MSASLVGSEMCIRDRRSSEPNNARALRSTSAASKRAVDAHKLLHAGGYAVSYTHLTLPTICSV
eukprot:6874444-Alexandrium_andersonii.AAC.1